MMWPFDRLKKREDRGDMELESAKARAYVEAAALTAKADRLMASVAHLRREMGSDA